MSEPLLVTGLVFRGMREALERTYNATPSSISLRRASSR
jgi:Ni,Fe-hydrogenase III small subunit